MKYAFFGTPEFSAIILKNLIETGMPPVALVCNPDKPTGRDKKITPPPTKQLIEELRSKNNELNIKVFQPESKDELIKMRKKIFKHADVGVVAAYAHILPEKVIEEPKLGIIGVHPSLLPKFRGATPIQSAILSGDEETGSTLYFMDSEVDHGQIIASKKLYMMGESYEGLLKKLAELSANLLIDILPLFNAEKFLFEAQDESEATYTKKFGADDGYIDQKDLVEAQGGNESSAIEILRKIRALNPEPGVYTFMGDKRTKLLDAIIENKSLVLKRIQKEGKTPIDL